MKFKHGIKLLSAALLAISSGGCGTGIPAAETEETNSLKTESFLAERVSFSDLQEGDRFLLVCPSVMRAMSSLTSDGAYSAVRVVGDAERITQVPEYTQVFTCERASDDGLYLHCEEGYLTADTSGWYLDFTTDKPQGSEWIVHSEDGLYNPGIIFEKNGEEVRDFDLVYGMDGRVFATWSEKDATDYTHFDVAPYRIQQGCDIPKDDGTGYRLSVFETSDIHGYICDYGEEVKYSYSWIAGQINQKRNSSGTYRTDTAILVDDGDIFHGNTISYVLNGEPFLEAFDYMDYDAITLGNHEFDTGINVVADPDQTMHDYEKDGQKHENLVPIIVQNLYQNGESYSYAKDYVILEKTAIDEAGKELPVRIGVIGYAEDYSGSIAQARFKDLGLEIREDLNVIEDMAVELEKTEGCQAVLLLTHADPVEVVDSLAEDTTIDLVLGGHVHMDDAGVSEYGIPYVMPDAEANSYGYAELVFDKDSSGNAVYQRTADVKTVSSDRFFMTPKDPAQYPEEFDPEIIRITDDAITRVESILNESIGYITEDVYAFAYFPESGERGSVGGNWVTSLLARACDADISFYNRYGLRRDFERPAGSEKMQITVSDVYSMFPFGNHLYCYELSGDELLEALEFSLTPGGSRLMPFIHGIDVYYTGKTVNAILHDGELLYDHGVWTEGHEKDTFRVAVNDYVATTAEREGDINPLVRFNNTDRLLFNDRIDNTEVLRVLQEEAKANNGRIEIDTKCHIFNADYKR